MKQSIVASLSPLEASEVTSEYMGSPMLRKRLVALLRKKQEAMRKKRLDDSNYACPNWVALQADGVGYERGLDEIIDLIS